MITLSSKNYKKEDYIALMDLIDIDLSWLISCYHYGTNICNECKYKQSCRDIHYLYSYLQEKIKNL